MQNRINVLHVDDESDFADLTAQYLEREEDRISVETAENAEAGLTHLAKFGVDCIVSDYDMPGQNGIEFLETVRKERPDLPFILFTGKGSEEVASEAINAGVTDYLQKETGTGQYSILANRIVKVVESYRATERLSEVQTRHQILREQLTELSIALFQTQGEDIDEKIDDGLDKIGSLVGADRSYVFQIDHEAETLSNTHEWCAEGIDPQIDMLQNVDLETFPWLLPQLRNFETIRIPDVSELPPEAATLQRTLREQNIDSLIVAPMQSEENLVGFIGFDWVQEDAHWSEEFVDILRMVGQLISSSLRAAEREHELEQSRKRFQTVFEKAPEAIAIHDEEGNVLDVNEKNVEMLDYGLEDLTSMNITDFEVGNARDEFQELWDRMDVGETRKIEGEYERKDGSTYAVAMWTNKIEINGDERFLLFTRDISDRREQEQRLKAERNRIEAITNAIPDLTIVYDSDGRYREIPTGQSNLLVGDKEQLIGSKVDDVLDPDSARRIRGAIEESLLTGTVQTIEYSLDLPGGRTWFEGRIAPLPGEKRDEVVKLSREVSERKRYERELEASEEKYRNLFENSRDALQLLDRDGYIDCNDQTLVMFDVDSTEKFLDSSPWEFAPDEQPGGGDSKKLALEHIEQAFEEGEAFFEYTHKRTDGTEFPAEVKLSRFSYGGEAVLLALIRDITERKVRERELAAAREASRKVIESSPMPIWVQDVEEILYSNEAAAAFYGHDDPDSLVGASALSFVPENQREPARERIHQMLETGESMNELTGRFIAKDGTTREAIFAAAPITYYGEQAIVVIANDITERNEQERQLRREKERLDDFASVVAHDLRNPLNVARGRIKLAQEECATDDLSVAADAVGRSLDLIGDLLTLARGGREIGDLEPVEVSRLVHTCWDTVETTDATIEADLESTIRADRGRLRQLVENLLRNAVEHGGANVTVRIGSLGNGFFVEDDGPGIPEEKREVVFEAGFSESQGGTGLGLSIVQQIVEAHGWDIRVAESSEEGARFEIIGVEFVAE